MALSLTAGPGAMLVPIVDRLTSVPDVAPGPGYANAVSALVQVAALARPEFLVEVEAVVAVPG